MTEDTDLAKVHILLSLLGKSSVQIHFRADKHKIACLQFD